MLLTPEQLCVVYCEDDIVLVEALAGTGKTTTLSEYAKEHSNKYILYLAFNKTVRKDAKFKFPKNVELHTINSFVYKYAPNSQTIVNEFNISFVMRSLGLQQHEYAQAVKIIEYLNNYLDSCDTAEVFFEDDNKFSQGAKKLVELMDHNSDFPITHNVLLKRFLDSYDFSSFNYDTILIDEAQDLNRSMFNIIKKLPGKKIFVGDIHQAIYGFRNTINVFKQGLEAQTLRLTSSYRFGPAIAEFINDMSEIMFKQPLGIRGANQDEIGEIIEDESEDMSGLYSAYITRTNAHLFDKAFELMKQGKKVSIPFDWNVVRELLLDVFYLKYGLRERIVTAAIRDYASFDYMQKVSRAGGDLELAFLIKVVEKYDAELPMNILELHNSLTSPKLADTILLTAHKCKGLEFFNVEIANDFGKVANSETEEKNLLYVAMTRAIEKLKPNKDLLELYNQKICS